ncbi:hypothetical protein N866_05180 [Actinotalea ferrariae CF5-4]|uniref:DUF2142 domain-containing protein n=1 Tax=Actinotalea ferrariae CF5-4 TaxID=948458 RepID=A0A021W0A7_9CELL|nr:hypothetical protein N866_05180 [Actinotalea ferrariae CF5-4]
MGAALLLVSLVMWALSSPVGSSPDEDYHLAGAWCGLGLRDGLCEPAADPAERLVPKGIVSPSCFAFEAAESAACQRDSVRSAEAGTDLTATGRGNFTGDYPPVFFAATGVLAGPDIVTSVMAMRGASALLFVLLGAAVAAAVPTALRRAMLAGFMITAVPLGMFLIPSVNPSGWAVISAVTFLVSVVGYMTAESGRRMLTTGALAAVALLVGAGARADASIYAVVAVGAALVLTLTWDRAFLVRALYPVLLAVVATFAYLSAGQSSALEAPRPQPFTLGAFGDILLDVPDLWVGALGRWGLGWLDTAMPPAVWALSWGVLVAVVFQGLARVTWRQGLAVGAIVAALAVVPGYLQFLTGHPVGSYVQPRYILPLLVLLAVAAMIRSDGRSLVLSGAQRWLIVVVLAFVNAVALHHNIRRYVTGLDVVDIDLDAGVEWWWALPVSPMVVWVAGTVAFAGALALLSAELTSPDPRAPIGTSGPVTGASQAAPPQGGDAPTGGDGASETLRPPPGPDRSLPAGDAPGRAGSGAHPSAERSPGR